MPTKQQREDLKNVRHYAPYTAKWFAYMYATNPHEADFVFEKMQRYLRKNDFDHCQRCMEQNSHDYQYNGYGIRLRLCGHCRDTINSRDSNSNMKLIICTQDK